RLQLVAGAVRALADLGEARDLARAKAHHAKETFCDMKQDLAPVHEESEIVEDKLIALRDNLIALGKSEADIAPAKAELPDIDRDVSEEHSIVRILELWQAMFRDTFLHYHRLSTALVRSGDAATALKLWHEYLLDIQSFLSGSVPADYENLTEHRRLCRVHRNLLASQRSVLINENKETTNRELADKFDTLTNLHNETLARIVDRHDEVCTRIAAWDDYREIYTELLRWLKEIEREKEKLQLRYVHIKRVHKILSKIQNLSDKLPEGKKFRDFLTRILGLIGEYENLTGELHKLYSRTQDEVMSYSDDDRLSRPQIKKTIEKYSETRKKIDKTETQIEALSVIQEQLKECLSPQDIRIVNQKVWQMRQQRAHDLKEDASGDEMATAAKEIAKAGAKPGQTLELAKHLSELLLTECDATEDEAMLKEVESLSLRYEDLLTQAKKRELQINNLRLPHSASYALTCEHESGRLTCPLCSERNWKQLDNDLWRLEQWLQFAEATDEARTDPPHNYDALEDAIQVRYYKMSGYLQLFHNLNI
ncbi:PREDICTED: nesprin-1-like, partial [Papilio polytes]|uniref:nesprin-1-like n=1 Tax=Papilio polytes TaxID=76194 RepID=UPI000676966E